MGLTPWRLRSKQHEPEQEEVPGEGNHDTADIAPIGRNTVRPGVEAAPAEGASAFSDWPELEAAVSHCTRCALAQGRKQTVFGVGSRHARWMLVGEAPGAEEDKRGEPFVGRAGRLLDAMLDALYVKRNDVFITNIVKCRPPRNRDPRPEEADTCRAYLDRQIEWVAPQLILALGRVSAQNLLGLDSPVGRMRGRVHEGPRNTPVVVTYHPAYLLRTPIAKRKVWSDLKLALATALPAGSDGGGS